MDREQTAFGRIQPGSELRGKRIRNPLRKRYPRELKGEFPRYLIIFLLMLLSIGFISGYNVADESMVAAYNGGFEKYNAEDGNFTVKQKLSGEQLQKVNELGITVYEQFYTEKKLTNGSKLRIFADRKEVNLVCLMEGAMPAAADEIAVDRMFADNNSLSIGDSVTTEGAGDVYRITGLISLFDYSTLFENNNDTMFDALRFGVAIVSDEAMASFPARSLTANYVWKYNTPPSDDAEEKAVSDELLKKLTKIVRLDDFVPQYLSQPIHFAGDDLQKDGVMMNVLLYMIIVILAFVFAVTMSNTIVKESTVIGTLLASGYTRRELLRHYMLLPILVTMAGALAGNILGYTWMKEVSIFMYYNSYSLPTYETVWSARAFLLTTLVPLAIMLAVNTFILGRSLRHTPIQFLRRDLSRRKKKKCLALTARIPFMHRFRLRVILQNIPNYLILALGIMFADLLLLFGLGLPNVLDNYKNSINDTLIADYQYMLSAPVSYAGEDDDPLTSMVNALLFSRAVETENPDAEKFSAWSLKTLGDQARVESIVLYGIEENSRYVSGDLSGGKVLISQSYADKYRIGAGDTITLKEAYEDTAYTFTIDGVNDYSGGVVVFMSRAALNETFGQDRDFFCGYFSDSPITDIDETYIGTVIDIDAMTKVPRQLQHSMGDMMGMVNGFAVIVYLILMYFLTKIIIEKNEHSISMVKILGYSGREIRSIYLHSTTIVTFILLAACVPVVMAALRWLFYVMMLQMISEWMPLELDPELELITMLMGAGSYLVVAAVEMLRIRRIPMDIALKNVE